MEIENKNFLIYGTGVSGISAYKFLTSRTNNVYIYSDKKNDNIKNLNVVNKFSDIASLNIDYAIVSPGVQIVGNKNIKKLKTMGIMLLSELELGYLFCKGKFIAVTGTNGKTTCVSLIHHVLSKKFKTFLCGNVGTPITSICEQTDENSVIVCEVSSFMLELTSPNFAPDVAVITNITPDHISRHKTFSAYCKTKLSITDNQTKQQYLIVPKELSDIPTKAKLLVVENTKRFKSNLIGDFNHQNLAICQQVCSILNVGLKEFKLHIKSFYPVKYRLELIGKKRGVRYINDSKSTNPDSTIKALESFKKNVVVLLGGSDKGNDFYNIFKCKNIKLAIVYGETANKIEADARFMGFNKTAKFENLAESLYWLAGFIKRGDVVLFSPACASYDEFNNYIERGEFFNSFYEEPK